MAHHCMPCIIATVELGRDGLMRLPSAALSYKHIKPAALASHDHVERGMGLPDAILWLM